ncbi:unnamed protein product, partial [Laminaria digitata]
MLCGQTAEDTMRYAENAREAIKGCYDVVSEEVLRAFLCLAHMHSFREDFPKFFRYTAMANDVAASLDRQGGDNPAGGGQIRRSGCRGGAPKVKGCSEPAKFLLRCFDAVGHFLELEGEEANSPIEGRRAPPFMPSSARAQATSNAFSDEIVRAAAIAEAAASAFQSQEIGAAVGEEEGGRYVADIGGSSRSNSSRSSGSSSTNSSSYDTSSSGGSGNNGSNSSDVSYDLRRATDRNSARQAAVAMSIDDAEEEEG